MSGNFIKPPTMGEGNEPVDLELLCEATGLPQDYQTPEILSSNLTPCIAATFSDGELDIRRPREEDPVLQEYFGVVSYREGVFGQRVRALLEGGNPTLQHQADRLIRYCAKVIAHQVVQGDMALPSQQNVMIHTGAPLQTQDRLRGVIFGLEIASSSVGPAIEFDEHSIALRQSPRLVIDYGPGLQGRFHIDRQLVDLQVGHPPYTYLAFGKGPFINQFLQQYWAEQLNYDQGLIDYTMGRLYIGREDGIAAASNELAAGQLQHTGSTEVADIVIASGIYTAGHDEMQTGIDNAYKLLRPGGILLTRAPKAVDLEAPDDVSAEETADMAFRAGFDRSKAQFFDVTTENQAAQRAIQSQSVIFRK